MPLLSYFIEHNRYLNLLGIIVILGIAWLFSQNRARIKISLIGYALFLQFLIAFSVLKTTLGKSVVEQMAHYIGKIYEFAEDGSAFIFGNLCNANSPWGPIFCVKVLPVIIFFGAFTALLSHWRIVQGVVTVISFVIRPLLGTSGAETLCAISNSFLGQTEAPLLVRNYLKNMTKSEMLVVMVSGMGTISGSILVVFASMGVPAKHMLAASVMAIPATILIAKMLLPETETSTTTEGVRVTGTSEGQNAFGAIAQGTSDGLSLAINVAAMLIAFIAFLSMMNYGLKFAGFKINYLFSGLGIETRLPDNLSIEMIFSYLFSPFGYLLGFTGHEALAAGQLVGTKVAVNEFIAYGQMIKMGLSQRAQDIITYALCGFSNFSCIGIQIGGIGALVPEKRAWLAELGLYAVLGGMLANLLSAMMAGLLL